MNAAASGAMAVSTAPINPKMITLTSSSEDGFMWFALCGLENYNTRLNKKELPIAMDKETSEHLGQVLSTAAEHWQLILLILGSAIGGILWWMKSVFATKEYTESCRNDVMSRINHDVSKLDETNTEQHSRIEHGMETMKRDIKTDLAEVKADLRSMIEHLLHTNHGDHK